MRCRMTRLRRTADNQRATPTDRNQSEADMPTKTISPFVFCEVAAATIWL